MNITKEQRTAAGEIAELLSNEFRVNKQIDPGTAISAAARLAGSCIFRSFNFSLGDIKPGTAVLSEEANEKGPILINVLSAMLSNLGINIDFSKNDNFSNVNPSVSFIDTLNKIQTGASKIMKENKLNYEQMAYSCAIATAFIIKECQKDLPVESGFNTAVYGFIEGSKTCPPELSDSISSKRSFFKFWK